MRIRRNLLQLVLQGLAVSLIVAALVLLIGGLLEVLPILAVLLVGLIVLAGDSLVKQERIRTRYSRHAKERGTL